MIFWPMLVILAFELHAPITMKTIEEIIAELRLEPHPEGGWFRRVFPSPVEKGEISSIYYLLGKEDFSSFHRLSAMTEIWYFLDGDPIDIHIIHSDGTLTTHRLGELEYQLVVRPDQWFAAEPAPGSSFCLVACAVSPSFDYEGFELAKRSVLQQQYPQHSELIQRLTRQ